jgi:hypothetical protein
MSARHAVHYVSVSSQPGTTVRLVCDVGQGKGIQRVTFTHAGVTGPAEVIVYNKIVFNKGNAFTKRVFFGFEQAQATKFAGRWIYITRAHPEFAALADGATFASFAASLYPSTQLSLVRSGSLIGVRGMAQHNLVTENETVFAPAHGTPLPVKETATYPGHAGHDVVTLSHWNEAIQITIPANAIPIEGVIGG